MKNKSYLSTIYKFKTLWDESDKLQYDIQNNEVIRNQVQDKKIQLIKPFHAWKAINSFSTDWEIMTDNYKQWTIEFDKFPIKWIPFIRCEPAFNHSAIASGSLDIRVNKLYQIKDTDIDSIKQTRLIVGAYVDSDTVYSIETRLIVDIINPERYL